jgi:Mn2+/Fe2+ NRAMP family transporter
MSLWHKNKFIYSMSALSKWNQVMKTFGPGILFASTCIGVSHLVQSTRAGAEYGFSLLLFIILANVLKYPFFEFGSRYASATGKSILEGYKMQGRWLLWLYLALSLVSMFAVSAAVTFVTAGMLGNLLGMTMPADKIAILVFGICLMILLLGQFKVLDGLLKVIASVLLVSTLFAFFASLGKMEQLTSLPRADYQNKAGFLFLIALMGWMPTAVDLSAWNSVWTLERIKQTGYKPTLKQTLADFNLGYAISTLLAVVFMALGAFVLFGTGTVLSQNSTVFAGQVISMYTDAIGPWVWGIIAVAAFSTMFSTAITVMDGYSRAMGETVRLLANWKDEEHTKKRLYASFLVIISIGSIFLISFFSNSMPRLVDFATTLSFVIAPVVAYMNMRVIRAKNVDQAFRPKGWLWMLAWIGLIFLTGFTLVYIYTMLFL